MERASNKELTPFGKRVAKALVDQNMTRKELAATVGIKPQYLSQILNGTRPGKQYIPDIVAALALEQKGSRRTSAA
ncbi:MAG: helix-turn-helix transcriptional regulator [Oscillospiraceae bacterium]|nr:helix-turn-helix transcriptional regulator [Oscillospiraceae bacterium]